MTCYIERHTGFVRCEIRDCGPGDGWELFVTEQREEEGLAHIYAELADDDTMMALPSEIWRRRR